MLDYDKYKTRFFFALSMMMFALEHEYRSFFQESNFFNK